MRGFAAAPRRNSSEVLAASAASEVFQRACVCGPVGQVGSQPPGAKPRVEWRVQSACDKHDTPRAGDCSSTDWSQGSRGRTFDPWCSFLRGATYRDTTALHEHRGDCLKGDVRGDDENNVGKPPAHAAAR